jgi:hypothetical protein
VNDRSLDEGSIGSGLVESCHGFIEAVVMNLSRGPEEEHKYSVRIVSVTAYMGIECFPNKNVVGCNYIISVDRKGTAIT